MNQKNKNIKTSVSKVSKARGCRGILAFLLVALVVMVAAIPSVFATANYDSPYLTATLMNQDPDPAEPGEYLDVRWKIEKSGNGQLEDVVYYLELGYTFFFDQSDGPEKHIDDWWGYSDEDAFYTLHYKIRVDDDALEDTYTVKLKAKYGDNREWVISEYDLRVADKDFPEFALGTLKTDPVKLVADTDEAELHVELENIGDGGAQNVKVKLDLPEGFEASYGYSDWENLGTVDAGSSETAIFYVDIDKDVSPGVKKSKLTVNYKGANDDDNVYKIVEIPFDIPLIDKPYFEMTGVSTEPGKIRAGDRVMLKIGVKNAGGKEAESVSIRAFKESSQPFEFDEKYDFVGKLDSGEEGEGVLEFTVDEDAVPKKYIMDMEVRYIYNNDVEVQSESFEINIVNGEQSKFVEQNFGLIIALVVVVLVIIGLLLYHRSCKIKNGKK